MPQISKYPLNRVIEQEMFHKFWTTVSKLKSVKEVSSFFSDLLTQTEEIMLAKRFIVSLLLLRGKRPAEISKSVHVSFSTIATVAGWLKNARPETKRILKRIIQESNWQKLLDKIDSTLDKLPLPYGTDWKIIGKEKWDRKIKRDAREVLS